MSNCKETLCYKLAKYKGLCRNHYRNLKLYGSPTITMLDRHNNSKTCEYSIYYTMRSRCINPDNKSYKDYGARGITISERWLGFEGFRNFINDMGMRPSKSHSIDRIDNNRGYSPDNCQWVTKHIQMSNRSNSNDVVGVSANGVYWEASLIVNKVRVFRKAYKDKQLAIEARRLAEIKYLGATINA